MMVSWIFWGVKAFANINWKYLKIETSCFSEGFFNCKQRPRTNSIALSKVMTTVASAPAYDIPLYQNPFLHCRHSLFVARCWQQWLHPSCSSTASNSDFLLLGRSVAFCSCMKPIEKHEAPLKSSMKNGLLVLWVSRRKSWPCGPFFCSMGWSGGAKVPLCSWFARALLPSWAEVFTCGMMAVVRLLQEPRFLLGQGNASRRRYEVVSYFSAEPWKLSWICTVL